MAFVDVHQCIVAGGQCGNLVERRDESIHRKHAVGGDQDIARAVGPGLLKLRLEVGHVAVAVAVAPCLAQPHTVDDRRVI